MKYLSLIAALAMSAGLASHTATAAPLPDATLLTTQTSFTEVIQLARRGRGADDPAGHVRQCRGCDDPPGHVRQCRGCDDPPGDDRGGRRNRGGDDGVTTPDDNGGQGRGRGRGRGRGGDDAPAAV